MRCHHGWHGRGDTHGSPHVGHGRHADHGVSRRWGRRFLTRRVKVIALVLQVFVSRDDGLTLLLSLVDSTVPITKVRIRRPENQRRISLLCKIVRTGEGLAAVRAGVRTFLSMGPHVSKRRVSWRLWESSHRNVVQVASPPGGRVQK